MRARSYSADKVRCEKFVTHGSAPGRDDQEEESYLQESYLQESDLQESDLQESYLQH